MLRTKNLRYLQLVEYLDRANQPVGLVPLSEVLQCTTRTIRDYAVELSDEIASDLLEVRIHHEKACLHYRNKASFEDFVARIISISTEFQLLEYILFHPGCSVTELSEIFYQSTTTLYRLFAKMGPILEDQFGIELKTNPCSVEGPEINVRHFFAQLFTEKYVRDEWIFEGFSRSAVEHLIFHAESLMSFNTVYIPIRWLTNLLVVSLIRLRQGYDLEPLTWPFALIEGPESFQLSSDPDGPWLVERKEMESIFAPFSVAHFAKDFHSLIEESKHDAYYQESYLAWNRVTDCIEELVGFEISNRKEVILNMHNVSQIAHLDLFGKIFFIERRLGFFERLMTTQGVLFDRLKQEIFQIQTHSDQLSDPDSITFLAYTFVAICEDLLLKIRLNKPKIKVLVVSNIDFFHANFMLQQIQFFTANQVMLQIYHGSYLTNELGQSIDHDIVVANIALPDYEYRPVLTVKDVLDDTDFASLHRMLRAILNGMTPPHLFELALGENLVLDL